MTRPVAVLAFLVFCSVASTASADPFASPKDCIKGKRVTDMQGNAGTVVELTDDELCKAHMDATGKDTYFIFWMLTESGKSAPPTVSLENGIYECFANGRYTFMNLQITSATTYATDGGTGRFHLESDNRLVFENGPFSNTRAKLDRGPRILISTDGSFYGTSCQLRRQ